MAKRHSPRHSRLVIGTKVSGWERRMRALGAQMQFVRAGQDGWSEGSDVALGTRPSRDIASPASCIRPGAACAPSDRCPTRNSAVSFGPSYRRLQTFLHAQPAPGRQTRRCVQATAACSTGLVLPTAIWMLDGAIDMVASARGVSIATADRSATIPAVRSRRLGMRSSAILRSGETTRWRTLPDIGATPQCKRGDTRFKAASMDADRAWPIRLSRWRASSPATPRRPTAGPW